MNETPNSSFSSELPELQLGIDSTSLGAFKRCPRAYQLGILEGWRTAPAESWPEQWNPAADLQFGLWMHEGRERYEDWRLESDSHDEALERTLQWLMEATWDRKTDRPWASGNGIKNRFTLVRTLTWYLDKYQDDPLETFRGENGRPMIEHSFRYDSGYRSRLTGESFLLCGHLDKVGSFQGSPWLSDLKSTKSGLDRWYVETFTPDNQFTLYLVTGHVALPVKVRGLMLDAAQVLASGARFERFPIVRTQWVLDEWYQDLGMWLRWLEDSVERLVETGRDFPMNDKACFRCEFRGVCSKGSEGARAEELQRGFRKRSWDPLQARGE